ncbi:Conserved oligomeric Golgi complex subunit [Trichinella pseudospiralis]
MHNLRDGSFLAFRFATTNDACLILICSGITLCVYSSEHALFDWLYFAALQNRPLLDSMTWWLFHQAKKAEVCGNRSGEQYGSFQDCSISYAGIC